MDGCGNLFVVIVVAMLSGFFAQTCAAGGGPENLVLVVNADSAASKLIANHYIHGRKIPARNIVYINGIPDRERITLDEFRQQILIPVLRQLEERKLANSIDYIVYSADFPTIVSVDPHLKKLLNQIKQQTGREDVQTKIFGAQASINALTFYAAAVLADQPGYMLLDSNSYYRHSAQAILRRPFVGKQQQEFESAILQFGMDEAEQKTAIKSLKALAKENPFQVAVLYWLARFYAQAGDAKSAAAWLTRAVRAGWSFQTQTKSDLSFEKVKDDPLFKGIVNRIPDEPFIFVPTRGFRHVYSWGVNGMLNSENGQGNRFFLSTVLAVTRNQGTTEKEALRQLKVSMKSDGTRPPGTFYFSNTKDVRNTTRFPNYKFAVNALERLGHKAEIITTVLPMQKKDVLGLTTGSASFNWTASGSKIIPGAICDNLTSFGGKMDTTSQTKLSEFIRNGAAGSSGTVTEPFSIQAKFPHPMIHAHYARGCSLAEAFYQSLQGPFQLLIVGDALCQPWATRPVVNVTGLNPDQKISGDTVIKIDVSESPVAVAAMEMYVDGVLVLRSQVRDRVRFDTANIPDGYHELRIVVVSSDSIQTTGNAIIPFQVDNQGNYTELSTENRDYLETDEITFVAKSNYGDSIELLQNMRSIAKKIGRNAEFKIPAKLLGRGPVKLEAIALSESGKGVSSMPLELNIEGRISVRRDSTTSKKATGKKTPRKKTTGKK